MFKKFVAALSALLATAAFAAVEVNKATQAELEAIPGVGPVTSTLIINERKKSEFKDWTDFVSRVQGVGDRSAAKFSEGGLTVGGKPYAGAPASTKVAQASTGAKAVEATKATAAKAASAVKTGAKAVASGVKSTGSDVKGAAKEETAAAKESAGSAKAKLTEKKADKADKAASGAGK